MKTKRKKEIVEEIVDRTDIPEESASKCYNAIIEIIIETVASGNEIGMHRLGRFCRQKRKARNGINPKSGEHIYIPEVVVPKFRPSVTFKNYVSSMRGKS